MDCFIPQNSFRIESFVPDVVIALAPEELLAVVEQPDGRWRLPYGHELELQNVRYLNVGKAQSLQIGALELPPDFLLPEPLRFVRVRTFNYQTTEACANAVCRSKMLLFWDKKRRFCGACGNIAEYSATEVARVCPSCGAMYFPVVAPAVIVLIEKADKILLAHNLRFKSGMRSLIAGFVESGETLEQAARREIAEEMGLEVGELKYYGSQSWPYPNSLMVGFTTTYVSGELHVDGCENDFADWYGRDELPPLPDHGSIARAMIEDWINCAE